MSDFAVIGCGEIGGPVARRLLQAGAVLACDNSPQRRAALAAAGLRVTERIEDCAAVPTILLCPATDAQVLDIVAGLAAAKAVPEAVAVLSTVSPVTMRRAGEVLAPKGIALVDAPVSGGSEGAEAGTLTVMMGGEADAVVRLAAVFATFAAHVLHCGPLGTGQVAKLANNAVCHINTVLMAEVMRLGQAHGFRPDALAAVMERGTGRNYLTNRPGDLAGFFAAFAGDEDRFGRLMAIFRKDLALAEDLAQQSGAEVPAISAISALMRDLGPETRGTWAALPRGE